VETAWQGCNKLNAGGPVNREWHKEHKMPKAATESQRLQWHLEHTRNCECRPFPQGLLAKLSEQERNEFENIVKRRSTI
jgi:hypothetical protein